MRILRSFLTSRAGSILHHHIWIRQCERIVTAWSTSDSSVIPLKTTWQTNMTSYLKAGVLHPIGYPKTCTFFDLSCIFITGRGEPLTLPPSLGPVSQRLLRLKKWIVTWVLYSEPAPRTTWVCFLLIPFLLFIVRQLFPCIVHQLVFPYIVRQLFFRLSFVNSFSVYLSLVS